MYWKTLLFVFTLLTVACGKSGESQSSKLALSSTSASSSSSPSVSEATVQFVYPTQNAHLGGATTIKPVVKVIATKVAGIVSGVMIGSEALIPDGNFWVSADGINIGLTDDQVFEVNVEVNGQLLAANSLVLNNLGGSNVTKAGGTRVYSVRGLAFDNDSENLYISNPFDAELLKYNSISGVSEVIYAGTTSINKTEETYWPIAVDSNLDTIYVSADSYGYDALEGREQYTVNLIEVLDIGSSPIINPINTTLGALQSTRGLVADIDSVVPSSGINTNTRYPTLYSLDWIGQNSIQRWSIRSEDSVRVNPLKFTLENPDEPINAKYGVLALTAYIDPQASIFLVALEHSTANQTGDSSIFEITTSADEEDVYGSAKKLTSLSGVTKPSALAFNRDGTNVYIADSDRIWKMDLTTFNKTLISSSSLLSGKIGTGPSLGSNITAMALHPTLNYLYLAADTNGVIMVDLDTGNRITIIK